MPIRAKSFADRTYTCTVHWGEEEAEVTYRPDVLTPKLRREITNRLREGIEKGDSALDSATLAILTEMIVSWDVMKTAQKPYPTTPEGLAELPDRFLVTVHRRITEDLDERTEQEGKVSGNGSRPKDESVTALSGS